MFRLLTHTQTIINEIRSEYHSDNFYNIIFREFGCQENLILSVGKSLQRETFAQLPENCFENSLQV